jgi:hypothetical protein
MSLAMTGYAPVKHVVYFLQGIKRKQPSPEEVKSTLENKLLGEFQERPFTKSLAVIRARRFKLFR